VAEDFVAALQAQLGEHYRLLDEVGRGGMARVYRATDLVGGGEVAVKVLRPELAAALGHHRFLREIRILARLRHPNILPLLDSSEAGGSLYYVSPYIAGSSLQRRLAREASLPLREVVRIARDVAAALDHAHQSEVIHRDVKPGNVLLDDDRALVCDFGIARAVELAGGDKLASSSGFAVGTPAYMSPEQATGGAIDSRCDVYGLGCVMYEMLTGEAPFGGVTAQAVLARSLAGDCRTIRTVRPDVAPAAEAAIRYALASDPERRPGSGGELVRRFTEGASLT
jgi:serine/threonine protein kinase